MYGDCVIFIKTKWNQFWCKHDYKPDRIAIISGWENSRICSKCGRVEM